MSNPTQLIDSALEQIKQDVANGDFTAIEQLLLQSPTEALETFISETEQEAS